MVYYVEVNMIAIIVGLIMLNEAKNMTSKHGTSQIILNAMIWVLILFSASDIVAYCLRGHSYLGVEISNISFFILMALGSYLWFVYICVKMSQVIDMKHLIVWSSAPITILCIAILCNPWSGFFFTVDDKFMYHRGPGVIVTWIVEWAYIVAAIVVNVKAVIKEKRTYRKHELKGYLFFFIPIAAAAIVQMIFYGTTTSQIGFMIALLMAFNNRQFHLVQRDELTGLNNKNAFLSYRDYIDNTTKGMTVTLFMMDADNFKSINDNYGHMKGDQALKDIADILKMAAAKFRIQRVILYRYAGDEFIIVGTDLTEENVAQMKQLIHSQVDEMNEQNKKHGEEYHIGLSIGSATAECTDIESFDRLLKAADEAMYEVKKTKKSRSAMKKEA